MRFVFIFSAVLFLTACSKAKLNQPCTIQFKSDFISSNGNNNDVYTGTMSISRILFTGSRKKGANVEIEKELADLKAELTQNNLMGVDMNIPIGEYNEFDVKIRLSKTNSLTLRKNLEPQVQLPVVIQISKDLDLSFKRYDKSEELEKDQTYGCILTWNFFKLFTGFNNQQWVNATSSMLDGEEVILINETNNVNLYQLVLNNIDGSLSAKFE